MSLTPFVTKTQDVYRIYIAIGLVFLCLVVIDITRGEAGEPSARWVWLSKLAIEYFGYWGYTALKAIIGIIFVAIGMIKK